MSKENLEQFMSKVADSEELYVVRTFWTDRTLV